jgi:hypothetical protein
MICEQQAVRLIIFSPDSYPCIKFCLEGTPAYYYEKIIVTVVKQ